MSLTARKYTKAEIKNLRKTMRAFGIFPAFLLGILLSAAFSALLGGDAFGPSILILSPLLWVLLARFRTGRMVKKVEKLSNAIIDKISSLESVDYYFNNFFGGLGVDMTNRQIIAIVSDNKGKLTEVTFAIDELSSYEILKPGHTEYTANEVHGTDLSSSMNATMINANAAQNTLRKNIASQQAANAKTGLYFFLDNLNHPKVFAPMEYEVGESWMLLIKKLLDGSLQKSGTPVRFPNDK
jgi:hypothetical protein